jgi:hypothetical protein
MTKSYFITIGDILSLGHVLLGATHHHLHLSEKRRF